MSVTTTDSVSGSGFISDERTEDGLLKVHGIALGDNDVTRGSKSGEEKIWLPEVLQESAHLLSGKDIVVDHDNRSAYKTVGRVTKARYEEGTGVIYEGVVQDEKLEPKIQHGWLDVSPKLIHSEDHNEVSGIKAPKKIMDFPNLSIVRKGASPSNELNVGEHSELSAEELQAAFDDFDENDGEYHFVDEELAPDVDFSDWLYETAEGAQGAAQAFPCNGIHQHDIQGKTWYMPCSDHDKFLESYRKMKEDELAEFGEDDYVQWGEEQRAHGQIVDWTDDGTYDASIDGDVSVSGTEDDPAALIQIHQETDEGWKPVDTMVAHKFSTLNDWNPDNVLQEEDNEEEEELQLSQARMPEYSGTETSSWDDVSKTLETFKEGASGDVSDVEMVDDLSDSQKQEIASHTLLGDAEGDSLDELLFFPVVNPNNSNLNRGALEAVRGGRGQAADIPQDAYATAFRMAGRLLNEEFDADVEEEMMISSIYDAVESVELQIEQDELDEVYSDWDDAVNMTASELRRWSGNPCSREASVDPEAVIERNLNLLETPKSEWGEDELKDADRTVSFISRMSDEENEPDNPRDGSFGCPSDWAISLLNWAYNPFDSIPEKPGNDDLDEVEELEMVKHGEYSKEEQKMASQMSSHSEMTKMEALGLLSSMKPNRPNDLDAMSKMLASSLGAHKEEMRKMLEQMSKHASDSMGRREMEESMQKYLEEEDSELNKIFE